VRDDDFFPTQRPGATTKLVAVDRVTVADEIGLRIRCRKSFDTLVTRPFGSGEPRPIVERLLQRAAASLKVMLSESSSRLPSASPAPTA